MHSNEAFRTYVVGRQQGGRVQFREVANAPAAAERRPADPAAYQGHGRDGGICVHSQGDHYPLLVVWVEWHDPAQSGNWGWWKIFAPGGRLLWTSNGARNPAVRSSEAHARAEELAASYR